MQIKIGSFSKRHNSTKQPGRSWGTTLAHVDLKEDCSMEDPVFRIGFANWNTAYNYIYVPSWERYYFVIDVTVRIGRIWEVSCRLDAAATYKSDIQATTAFVLYDTAANNDIIDSRLALNTQASVSSFSTFLAPNQLTAAGKFVITVVGDESTQAFIVDETQLMDIIKKTKIDSAFDGSEVMQPADYDYSQADQLPDGTDIETWIKIGAFVKSAAKTTRQAAKIAFSGDNPLDFIRSAIWYPWDIQGDGQLQEIKLGTLLPTGVMARPIVNKIRGGVVAVAIPWQANDWRRNAPYHHIYLYIPFIGMVQLSNADIIDVSVIHVGWALNKITGEFNVQVMRDYGEEGVGNIIGVYAGDTAASVPIGASNISPRQAINSIVSGVGAVASVVSGNVFGAAALAAQSIGAVSPSISCIGGASGGAAYGLDMNVICFTVFHNTSAEPNTIASVVGTPTMAHHSLSGKSGYVQTQDISIQGANMSDAVRQELNQMCDNGIFIE